MLLFEHCPARGDYLLQLLLRGEAQAVDGVGAAICPLAKLLGGFGEGHIWGDGAVDNGLAQITRSDTNKTWEKKMNEPLHSQFMFLNPGAPMKVCQLQLCLHLVGLDAGECRFCKSLFSKGHIQGL